MPDRPRFPFNVPHYHVLLRTGYLVWTYGRGPHVTRSVRWMAEKLSEQGHRPIILTCYNQRCRIYGDGTLTERQVHARIDAERHPDEGYVQIRPAPPS